ncbi:GAF domain-containing protein [Desulfobacterales bacterium HSG2]|nr:GAF domain-containing protein [Desulfobacterales bacterium HSG2]
MDIKEIEIFLSGLEMFYNIKKDDIKKIALLFSSKEYRKSDTIIREGDPGLHLFIIVSGRVEVLLGDESSITFLKVGEVFGEMSLLSGAPIGATIKTIETTEVLYAKSSVFNEILNKYPPLQMYFARLLRQRLAETNKETECFMGRLKAAYKISEATHTAQNLEELYPEIHKIVSERMPAKNFYIALYDRYSETRSFPYFVSEYKEYPKPVSIEKGLSGHVLRTQKPLLGTDEVLAELSDQGKIKQIGKPSKSWLGVPLKTQKKTIGVMAVYTYDEDVKYGEEELNILLFVSEQVAMAIERVQAHENLEELVKERTAQLNTAYKISEAAHTAQNLEELYPEIHKIVSERMPAKNFYIALYNPSTNTLSFPYFINNKGEVPPESMPVERGFSGYILRTQKPLFGSPEKIKTLIEDGKIIPVSKAPVSFWLGVPLKTRERMTGVLAAYDYDKKVIYSKDGLEILTFVSEQIAMAIERVRSQDELKKLVKERTERLEKVHQLNLRKDVLIRLSQKLASSIQLEQNKIFNLIHKNASELMDTDNMYIALYDEANDFVRFPLAFKGGEPTTILAGKERKEKGGKGRTEYIIEKRESMFCATKQEAEEWYKQPGHGEFMQDTLASYIGVPMMVGEKVLGVVATYHPTEDYVYNKDDLDILQAMANIAAIALDNARLYHQLIEAHKKIADVTEINTRTMITADFVHKLNNLAGAIPIWVDQIRDHAGEGLEDKTLNNYLNKIDTDVENLLSAARQISSPPEEDINIEPVLKSLFRRTRLNQPDNIEIYLECGDNLPKIHFVLLELESILDSVIQNALDAMAGGGKLTIQAQETLVNGQHQVEIQIRDTGMGVSAEKIDKIFSPFHSTKTGHMGYGLWRAKDIIEKNGGTIEFESEEGQGTIVTIRIPALKESENGR